MCNEAVRNWPWLSFIPDHLRTQQMCNKIMRVMPNAFYWISERFKTQGMCKKKLITLRRDCLEDEKKETEKFFFGRLI